MEKKLNSQKTWQKPAMEKIDIKDTAAGFAAPAPEGGACVPS
ncbi:hypothetical protein [Gymnodinialimonas sp.]